MAITNDTYVTVKRNKKNKTIKASQVKVNDYIKSFNRRVTYSRVLDVFPTVLDKRRQRIIELENGISVQCSDNHAVLCKFDDELIDVFPDDITTQHEIYTDDGFSKVSHVYFNNTSMYDYIDIIVEDYHYFCSSNPDIMVLCYN